MALARIYLKISGRVQGVNFRYYTSREAQALGLTGWVKNCSDGTVEVAAEGQKEALEILRQWVQKGPSFAQIDHIEAKWQKYQGEFSDFEILY